MLSQFNWFIIKVLFQAHPLAKLSNLQFNCLDSNSMLLLYAICNSVITCTLLFAYNLKTML